MNSQKLLKSFKIFDDSLVNLIKPIDDIHYKFQWKSLTSLYTDFELRENASIEDIHYLPIWRYVDENKYMAYL